MLRFFIIAILLFLAPFSAWAETWDYITSSGEYYYGVGTGKTEEEADQAAIAYLVKQIATHVSADFTKIDDISTHNGDIDHNSRVLSCVKTYAQTTLTNTERWPAEGTAPNITVRRHMKKSELARIFDNRIAKAKGMVDIAEQCIEEKKIDMALQFYYWAYSLIRSVQYPNEVKDARGKILVDLIPVKIDQILSDIDVKFDQKDGDCIDLLFYYKDQPVSSLAFNYSDGRTMCESSAKDGRGMIEMIPDYVTDVYHLDIEYEYKNQARGDAEMESVLAVITPKTFAKSAISVRAESKNDIKLTANAEEPWQTMAAEAQKAQEQTSFASEVQVRALQDVIKAIGLKRYSDAMNCFTLEGLEMYNKLISYGTARLVGEPEIKYYKGLDGRTVARGLKMSFSVKGKQKKTFVEDITFTFNPDNKIENVAFGLGKVAEDGIFLKEASGWTDDVREVIVEFMENYKTAYSLKRHDYISSIFADDAIIIVGNKVRRKEGSNIEGYDMSFKGKDIISYNRYDKNTYLNNLKRCFARNEFINLKFTDNEVQWLEKFEKEKLFAINIRQQYCSSTYADEGYLFLLVDMTNRDEPLIKVRTWQPNEVSISKLYNAGDFFND